MGAVGRLNHGRQQIPDAPAQAVPANVPRVPHTIKLLSYIQKASKLQLVMYSIKCVVPGEMQRPVNIAGYADSTRQAGRSHNLSTAVIPEHLPTLETWKVKT